MKRDNRPRAKHTHPRRLHGRMLTERVTQPGPPVELAGGPLDGCQATPNAEAIAAGRILVPGKAGRYVRIDGVTWSWEDEHRPDPAARVHDHNPVGGLDNGWLPGDPCASCGSTQTVLIAEAGEVWGECSACGRSDQEG